MKSKEKAKKYLKIIITILLIWLIIEYMGGWSELVNAFSLIKPVYIALAFIIATLDRVLMAYKWRLLLIKRDRNDFTLSQSVKIYCSSMIWGLFLPSTIGADALRIYITKKHGFGFSTLISSIFLERAIGFIVSLAYAVLGIYILYYYNLVSSDLEILLYILPLLFTAAIIVFSFSFSTKIKIIFKLKWFTGKFNVITEKLKKLHDSYISYSDRKYLLIWFSVLTIIEQFFAVFFTWSITLGLGLDVELFFIVGVIPLAILAARLPISIDGIGVFEGIFMLLMSLAGISPAHAVAIALLGRIIQTLSWVPWWLAYMIENKEFRPALKPNNP